MAHSDGNQWMIDVDTMASMFVVNIYSLEALRCIRLPHTAGLKSLVIFKKTAFISALFKSTAQRVCLPPSLFISWHKTSWLGRLSQVPCCGYRGGEKRESNDNIEEDMILQIVRGMQGRFPLLYRMAIYSQAWGARAPADLPPSLLCIHGVCQGCAHHYFHTVMSLCFMCVHVCLSSG